MLGFMKAKPGRFDIIQWETGSQWRFWAGEGVWDSEVALGNDSGGGWSTGGDGSLPVLELAGNSSLSSHAVVFQAVISLPGALAISAQGHCLNSSFPGTVQQAL